MLRLILVAAQRAMVNTVVDVALAAKLEPVGVDLVPFAMARAVGMPEVGMEDEEGGEEAIVDIGATVTNILVHERGVTRFVRILPSGGRDITLAIARNFGVESDVAERLKRGEAVEGGPDLDEVHRAPPCSARRTSSTRCGPRSSSTRPRPAERGSAGSW